MNSEYKARKDGEDSARNDVLKDHEVRIRESNKKMDEILSLIEEVDEDEAKRIYQEEREKTFRYIYGEDK